MEWLQTIFDRFTELFKWCFVLQPWEQGLRVRAGRWTKKFEGGMHIRIPYLDTIFRQNVRFRISDCGHQTLTTADDKTITMTSLLGYKVVDVTPLYTLLHSAEETIVQMVQELVSDFVTKNHRKNCSPDRIKMYVHENIDFSHYGLSGVKFAIVNFAVVKTYRLINEGFFSASEHKLVTDQPDEV